MAIIEAEQMILDVLCPKGQVAVDVGANLGYYTQILYENNNMVYAYEPIPELYNRLNDKYIDNNIIIKCCAISEKIGELFIYIPTINQEECFALASCYNKYDSAEKTRRQLVKSTTLDNEQINDVGFIKIDVEGYEYEVLNGALVTLKKYTPNLLIELEERHRKGTIYRTTNLLYNMGYRGFYIDLDKYSLEEMVVDEVVKNQNIYVENAKENDSYNYINNFIFINERRIQFFINEVKYRIPQIKLWRRMVKVK